MKKPYSESKRSYEGIVAILLLCTVVFLTVGYSAFSTELGINGISAIVRVQKDVRIDSIVLTGTTGESTSHYEEHNVKNVYSSITLPNENSSVTYDVVIHNLGNVEMGILDITGLPSNLKYSISNYNLKEPLCDDEDSTQCKLGTTTTLHIKIEYNENGYNENNIDYALNLEFNFKRVFSITYKNITNNNYPSNILEDETLEITFVDDVPDNISVSGASSYTYNSPKLTLINPVNDIVINGSANSRYYELLTFDGSDYVNTGIYLFNEENINKNFEISFELSDVDSDQISQATILNAMEEKSPYPGFVVRVQTDKKNIEFNSPKIKNRGSIKIETTNKIIIKRINDIYYLQVNDGNIETLGTYSGATFDVPVTLGASPDTNPVRYFKGTLKNVSIELYDPEKYTIHFDANGGTGTMSDQIVRKDETVTLSKCIFEKDNKMVENWNTKPDGSGTTYELDESVTNIANGGETITLYAMWMDYTKYNIRYNANGGTGTMSNQELEYGTTKNLSNNQFSKENSVFVEWNTKSDGSGTEYENNQSVKNLTRTDGDIVDLYAIWSDDYYIKSDEYVFDGTNYIDTGMNLFSATNISKDFKVSFEIVTRNTSSNQATIMSCMDESGSPWPGMVYRILTGTQEEIHANVTTNNKFAGKYNRSEVSKVTLKRKDSKLYIKFNDEEYTEILNMSGLTKTFDVPLTFGSSSDASGAPQRYFSGTLKNMNVYIIE